VLARFQTTGRGKYIQRWSRLDCPVTIDINLDGRFWIHVDLKSSTPFPEHFEESDRVLQRFPSARQSPHKGIDGSNHNLIQPICVVLVGVLVDQTLDIGRKWLQRYFVDRRQLIREGLHFIGNDLDLLESGDHLCEN